MILIDGYNLMHAAGLGQSRYDPGDLERARRSLLEILAQALGGRSVQTTVVFDAATAPPGASAHQEYKGIEVRFAAQHADADALLEELIEQAPDPQRLTVVSSDRRLRWAARQRRASVIDSEAFLREILQARKEHRPSPSASVEPREKFDSSAKPDEVDYWLKVFEGIGEPPPPRRGRKGRAPRSHRS